MAGTFAESASLPDPAASLPPDPVIFGSTAAMAQVREKVSRLADTEVPVLIRGESGTGKEIIARLLHVRSGWSQGPFVKVHCPAVPATLLESELFGYEEGSFTGATRPKPGRVEAAEGGTLFLDEIAELDSSSQAKLLQVLQDRQVFRIGAQEEKRIQVRVICATDRDLEHEIQSGNFRQDLFYRVNVVSIFLPPLRERREDIPQLAEYFLGHYAKRFRRPARPFSAHCLQLLQEETWPGNIRELENWIIRYVILGSEEALTNELASQVPGQTRIEDITGGTISLRKVARRAAREAERKVILQVLRAHDGNRKRTANALHISYRALLYKIKEAGIPPKRVNVGSAGPAAPSHGSDKPGPGGPEKPAA
jgi:two-component system, NtrC family, response regulator AtoC